MFNQGTPHKTHRGHGLIIAAALAAFALTAGGVTATIRSIDREAAAAPSVAAAPAHHEAAATTDATVAVDAPKNTHSAEAPAYRPAAVQVIDWDMTEKVVEIAPGKVVKVWTFADRVPGPVVRVRVGDLVRVTIRNRTTMPHFDRFPRGTASPPTRPSPT